MSVYLSQVLTILIMVGGWVYGQYILILISNVMMAATNSETKFEHISREVTAFCESESLSKELTAKIKSFYKFKFQMHYFNEEAIRKSTTASLKKEISMHKNMHLLMKVPIFKEIPQVLLEKIFSCLKMEIYFPNDLIIRVNTLGDSMFFLAYGTAAAYSGSGMAFGIY